MYLLERDILHYSKSEHNAWVPICVAESEETLKTYNRFTEAAEWSRERDSEDSNLVSDNGFRITWVMRLYA